MRPPFETRGGVELVGDEGGWHFLPLGPDLLVCERTHRLDRDTTAVDVAGPYWFLGLAVTERGRMSFRHGDECIVPEKVFAVFIPPYGVVRADVSGLHQRVNILISSAPLPPQCPREPVLFTPPAKTIPTSVGEVPHFLARGSNLRSLAASPLAISRRAKAQLDAHFRGPQSLSALAARLRVPHAVMTRRFKQDFGIAPAKYVAAMRVMDAAMTLVRGDDISSTALRVGFGDLGRFYKQFRAVTSATPARYRPR